MFFPADTSHRAKVTLTLLLDIWLRPYPTVCRSTFRSVPRAHEYVVRILTYILHSSVPILALVDADAYGLDILSVYKYGSRSLRHEVGKLAAARMEWMGVKGSELNECVAPNIPHESQVLSLS